MTEHQQQAHAGSAPRNKIKPRHLWSLRVDDDLRKRITDTAEADGYRDSSDKARAMLAYAEAHMPPGWRP